MSASIAPGNDPGEAIEQLIDRHGGQIYGLGLRLCGNPHDAEELVQETFLRAFRKWHQFEGRSSASTWLYSIATRVCHRRHRRRAGEPKRMESLDGLLPSEERTVIDLPADQDSPLEQLLDGEARQALEQAIAKLPESFRIPIVLKEILELPVSEVATILGLKEATVKTRLHRGRLALSRELRKHLPRRSAEAPDHSRQVCLDLLRAKQDAMDRGVPFRVPRGELCARCRSLFASLDLTRSACRALEGDTELPSELRKELLETVERDRRKQRRSRR